MRALALLPLLALAACQTGEEAASDAPPDVAATDYVTLCAPCHGAGGKGDGPAAAGLAKAPADLTGLAAANGGTFPTAAVMAQIWGYADGQAGEDAARVMPDFGPLLESPIVLFDAGDGIATPTPHRLVDLALYLSTLQGS